MQAFAVSAGRARLWVEAQGTGAPVVMLHAGVADRRMWRGQQAALAPDFCAVAYDRRGFGRTAHADEAYSHVADLLAVLDTVAPASAAISVGCSQGGRIAIDAALASPQRVRALVLVAPAVTGAPEATTFPPAIASLVAELELAEAAGDIGCVNDLEAHAWLDGPAEPRGRVGGGARALLLDMNRLALGAEQLGSEIEPPAAFPRLGRISVPVLLVWGDRDFPDVIDRCHQIAAATSARTLVVPGAAHLPNLEQPEQFNRELIEFCAAVGR